MTREEAINYAEAIKEKAQQRIEFYRRGHAHAPEVCYSDLAFLSAAISALREQEERRWIPVAERTPENIGLYLVIEKHWLDGSLGIKIAKWNSADWLTADRKSNEITTRVTHWMPLPEPPKEGGITNGC